MIFVFLYIYHYYIYCFLHQLNQSLKCSLWSFYGLAESSDREVTGSSEVKSLSKPSNHYSPVTLGLYGVGNFFYTNYSQLISLNHG